MDDIEDESIDLVLADLPYGTTYAPWDSVIDLQALWAAYGRICKPHAPIVLTASQPFSSQLVMSNPKWFRCEWVWDKENAANFANAKRQPLKQHEAVLVFSRKASAYHPQMVPGKKNHGQGTANNNIGSDLLNIKDRAPDIVSGLKYPKTIIRFPKHSSNCKNHPTEKPVELLRYLIRTYSNPGDIVLDNTMGSGSTGVAAVEEGRIFKGIELDEAYFQVAKHRIEDAISRA